MYIIAGLGNPTSKYRGTRHNVGFDAIDQIADYNGIPLKTKKHKALCGKGIISGYKVILVKPETYMNLSGESVRSAVDFYNITAKDKLIIIYDDTSLSVGQLRLRAKGSAGGHNGIKSIITHLNSDEFIRIKIGIGEKPNHGDLSDHVLNKFDTIDRMKIDEGIKNTVKAVEMILSDGIQAAMNEYNARLKS